MTTETETGAGTLVHFPSENTQPGTVSSGSHWAIGSWLSAALNDPNVCEAMKADIREWFDSGGHHRKHDGPTVLSYGMACLRRLSETATPGEWFAETVDSEGESSNGHNSYDAWTICAPGQAAHGQPFRVLFDSLNSTETVVHEEYDGDGTRAWDEVARHNAVLVVEAVNFVRALLAEVSPDDSASAYWGGARSYWGQAVRDILYRDAEGNTPIDKTADDILTAVIGAAK